MRQKLTDDQVVAIRGDQRSSIAIAKYKGREKEYQREYYLKNKEKLTENTRRRRRETSKLLKSLIAEKEECQKHNKADYYLKNTVQLSEGTQPDTMLRRETLELLSAYYKIQDAGIRNKFRELLRATADGSSRK